MIRMPEAAEAHFTGTGKKKKHKKKKSNKAPVRITEEAVKQYGEKADKIAAEYSCEVSDRDWERLVQDAMRRVTAGLTNDRFTLYGRPLGKKRVYNRNKGSADEVTSENYDIFIDNLAADSGELAAFILDDNGLLLKYIVSKLMSYDQYLKDRAKGFGRVGQAVLADAVYARLSYTGVEARLKDRLRRSFTRRRVEKLIMRNQNYEHIAREAGIRNKTGHTIEKHILESIPDNYIDLYPEAREIERHFVLHIGPTNSGKTYEAIEDLRMAPSGIYLAPLRLLACEIKDRLNEAGTPCDLRTGEERESYEEARHMSSTIEMLDTSIYYDVAVIDEAQMIDDVQRGGAWTAAILGVCADTVHVCMAEHAADIAVRLIEECGDSYEIVRHKRQTPLYFDDDRFRFPESVTDGDALIVFSKRDVLSCAAALQKHNINCSVVYGALPYDARKSEVGRFVNGETKVIVATDAIGMGMNLPIRRAVFLRMMKYDGTDTRLLYPEEVQQIAGRAGRYGIYDAGYYTAEFDRQKLKELYDSPADTIEQAPIGFPRSLIGIEGRLSDIMQRWAMIRDTDKLYYKGDISEMLTLCRWTEQFTDDKELTYSFATMPFDIKNEELIAIWQQMVLDRIAGKYTEYTEPDYDTEDLASMESAFRVCDLYYCYADRFGTDDKERISLDRREIAAGIADYLKSHELPVRRCRSCGRELAWNYPHQLCYKCSRRKK